MFLADMKLLLLHKVVMTMLTGSTLKNIARRLSHCLTRNLGSNR